MAYIPPGAKWYLADMVEELTIEGERDNIVHTNMVLIRADSPEEAFQCAEALGQEYNMTYTNPYGKLVTVVYRGLRDLNVIHGELEHGTELIYGKQVGLTPHELAAWVTPKEELGVFKPMEPYDGPAEED